MEEENIFDNIYEAYQEELTEKETYDTYYYKIPKITTEKEMKTFIEQVLDQQINATNTYEIIPFLYDQFKTLSGYQTKLKIALQEFFKTHEVISQEQLVQIIYNNFCYF